MSHNSNFDSAHHYPASKDYSSSSLLYKYRHLPTYNKREVRWKTTCPWVLQHKLLRNMFNEPNFDDVFATAWFNENTFWLSQ